MIKLDNFLTVKTADGRDWQILVLDTFTVDEYPNKNYIAYTFGEQESAETIKSYISVLNETENYFSLDSITDQEEMSIVKEAYENLIMENNIESGDF